MNEGNSNIQVEITDASEFYCFRLVFNPNLRSACCAAPVEISESGDAYCASCRKPLGNAPSRIEIMLHARSLVDLIHKCSLALCDWQVETTTGLILKLTRMDVEEARKKGLIP